MKQEQVTILKQAQITIGIRSIHTPHTQSITTLKYFSLLQLTNLLLSFHQRSALPYQFGSESSQVKSLKYFEK